MRLLTLLCALGLPVADAAPLLGTTDSFASSGFCKAYQCRLAGKDVLGSGLSEWRYSIKGEFPAEGYQPPEIIAILRKDDRIVSAHWVSGAQDTVLYAKSYNTKMIAALIREMTGRAPTSSDLLSLNDGCEASSPLAKTTPWNGRYRLSCLLTREFADALRFSFRVHLP